MHETSICHKEINTSNLELIGEDRNYKMNKFGRLKISPPAWRYFDGGGGRRDEDYHMP